MGYQFGKPVIQPVYLLHDIDKIRAVFNDNKRFQTPYGEDLKRVTEGYGLVSAGILLARN
jgi:hypothetical protein